MSIGESPKKKPAKPAKAVGKAKAPAGKTTPGVEAKNKDKKILIDRVDLEWIAPSCHCPQILMNAAGPFTQAVIQHRENAGENKAKKKKQPRDTMASYIDAMHVAVGKYHPDWLPYNIYGFPSVAWAKAMATLSHRLGKTQYAIDILQFIFVHGCYRGLIPLFNQPVDLTHPLITPADVLKEVPAAKRKGVIENNADWDKALLKVLKAQPDIYARPTMQQDITYVGGGSSRKAMMAYRARFDDVYFCLPIQHWVERLDRSAVVNLVHAVGQMMGVGAWRLERHGIHGGFHIVGDIKTIDIASDPLETMQARFTPDTKYLLDAAKKSVGG